MFKPICLKAINYWKKILPILETARFAKLICYRVRVSQVFRVKYSKRLKDSSYINGSEIIHSLEIFLRKLWCIRCDRKFYTEMLIYLCWEKHLCCRFLAANRPTMKQCLVVTLFYMFRLQMKNKNIIIRRFVINIISFK